MDARRNSMLGALLALMISGCIAAAQDGATAPVQGPMSVERVHNGFTVAPDVRISRLDGSTAWVAGAYAGWVIDEHLLLGGGIYGLTNPHNVRDLVYGGGVVGWLVRSDSPVSFGARTLLGVGQAKLDESVTLIGRVPFAGVRVAPQPLPVTVNATFHEHVFVAEPQADAYIRLTRWAALDVGVGYRAIGGGDRIDNINVDHQLNGVSGSISVQIGGRSRTGS